VNAAGAFVLGAIALVVVLLFTRGCVYAVSHLTGSHGTTHSIFPSWGAFGGGLLPLSIWGLINLALAIWVGYDASQKGQSGILWGLLVFFTGIVGLIVYLLVSPALAQRNGAPRPPGVGSATCPSCNASLQPEYKACPYCGTALRCAQCGKAVQGGWKVCPHCAAQL
jgi:RNA polymerase subunit RPABC4/transcription elongation factor Spt4